MNNFSYSAAGMALMFPNRLTSAKFEPRDPTPSAPPTDAFCTKCNISITNTTAGVYECPLCRGPVGESQPDSSSIPDEHSCSDVLLAKYMENPEWAARFEAERKKLDAELDSSSISPELAWLEARWKSALAEGMDDYANALIVAHAALKSYAAEGKL